MIIYYINYDGINCSVFDSQIYTYCDLLSRNNLKVTLINCDKNINLKEYKEKMKSYLNHDNLRLISLEKNKRFDFIINQKLINNIVNLIREENLTNEKIIIHSRGPFGSFIGLRVKAELKNHFNIKVISDFRGAVIDEYLLRHKSKSIIYKMILKLVMIRINSIQRFACKNSDYILCVSKKLAQYLKSRYYISCSVSIIPTCIDVGKNAFSLDQRIKLRDEMNLENRFIIVYCGGAQGYQNLDNLITSFINISKKVQDALFLILTRDKEIFEGALIKFNVDKSKFLIRTVAQSDVYKYLSAADVAMLLRENNNVNNVASPTKFAEYVNCNLPVFISHSIGDIDEINGKYNICIYEEDIDNIMHKTHEIKKNLENFKLLIDDYYDWNKNIKTIISIYYKV